MSLGLLIVPVNNPLPKGLTGVGGVGQRGSICVMYLFLRVRDDRNTEFFRSRDHCSRRAC